MDEGEHALQGPHEQASVLRGLLEAAVHAIVVVDERGEIVLVNPAAEALFGYGRGELIGESVEMLVPERFRDGHRGQRGRFGSGALTRRMGIGLDLVACRKDGTEFPAEIGLSRIQTDRWGVGLGGDQRHHRAQVRGGRARSARGDR